MAIATQERTKQYMFEVYQFVVTKNTFSSQGTAKLIGTVLIEQPGVTYQRAKAMATDEARKQYGNCYVELCL